MSVLREDIVKITYDVNSDPLSEVNSAVDDIVSDAGRAVNEVSSAVSEITSGAATAAEEAVQSTNKAGGAISGFFHDFADGFREGFKEAANANNIMVNLGNKIKGIPIAIIDKLKNGVSKVKDNLKKLPLAMLNKLKDGLKAAGAAALDASKQIAGMAVKGIGAGVAAVTGLGAAAVKMGSEYESAFAQVKTIMDPEAMGFDAMSEGIRKLSNETGIASTDLAGTVYNVISATGDTEHALDLAGQASQLAVAGFTDTDSALSVLTTSMNAYGLSADQAAHISDSLIMVQNKGVTTVADLASSMGKAIASASAYGVDLENLEAAYISITKAGINTAEGTTYISSMMKELGDSNSNVAKVLKQQTGKSFDQMMKEGQGLDDALQALSNSVNGDSTALMNLWSSAEAGKASSAIVGQGLDNFKDNLEELRSASGLTEDAFATMQNTFENKVSKMKTIGTNLLTSIYEGMKGDLGIFADFGIDAMQRLSDSFSEGGMRGLASALGDALSDALGMAVDQAPGIINTGVMLVESLLTGIDNNADRLGDGAVSIAQSLASGVGRVAPSLMNTGLHMVTSILGGIAANSDQIVPQAIQLVTNLTSTIASWGPTIMSYGSQIISNVAGGLAQSLPTLIPQGVSAILNFIQGAVGALPNILSLGVQVISSTVQGIVSSLPMVVQQGPVIIHDLITSVVSALPELGQAILEGLVGILQNLPGLLGGALKGLGGGILDGIKGWFTGDSGTEDAGATAVESVATGITSNVAQVETAMSASSTAAATSFSSTMTSTGAPLMIAAAEDATTEFKVPFDTMDLSTSGQMAGEGFALGLRNSRGMIMAEAQGIANDVQNTINSSLKIHSPSDVAIGQAEYYGKGMALGLRKSSKMVRSAATMLSGAVRGYADPSRSSASVANNSSRTTNNSYAPQFVLNMNGASATPANQRKVRKWVRDAFNETFNDLGRQSGYAMG